MDNTVKINYILHEIETLDYESKVSVMSRILNMLKHTKIKKTTKSLTNLKGLGKELWQKRDIDLYIAKERESWD